MGKQIKQWWDNGERGFKVCFYVCQTISILLIIVSFFVPPMGVIDGSVFAGIGELAFFPTLLSFYNIVMSGKRATLSKGNTTVQVGQPIAD